MAMLPPDPVYSLRCSEMDAVSSVCFHGNERLLAGTIKGNVFMWNLQTNRPAFHFKVGEQPITSLHHSPERLVTQEKGGTVTLWTMSNNCYARDRTISGNYLGYCHSAMHMSPNNPHGSVKLFYPCDRSTIGVLHITDPTEPIQKLVPYGPNLPQLGAVSCFTSFEFSSNLFLLAGYESGHFLTWNVTLGTVVDMIAGLGPQPTTVDYDLVTNRGVIGGASDKITVFSYQRPPTIKVLRGTELLVRNAGLNCVRIRGDRKVFASAGWDGRIRIFSWKSMRSLAVLLQHKHGSIMDLAFSPQKVAMWGAPIMAAAGMDGQISLWSLYN
ncbi:guanine nucleotide-binding protein subunit beta-like protein 1 [Scaptodrosophila lebanonensis]|uniref:Guanine nucleotide-binding protein subunit beta-like protein 1 n=1 Tax=Drosophila lebanonensis TaxID=7225 RepID=A0A6J2TQH8_DROLE|nr:guanine nucleotide-binding protein subunit beta-like protein 1 [Scaptodrosophila lebanonensis]